MTRAGTGRSITSLMRQFWTLNCKQYGAVVTHRLCPKAFSEIGVQSDRSGHRLLFDWRRRPDFQYDAGSAGRIKICETAAIRAPSAHLNLQSSGIRFRLAGVAIRNLKADMKNPSPFVSRKRRCGQSSCGG